MSATVVKNQSIISLADSMINIRLNMSVVEEYPFLHIATFFSSSQPCSRKVPYGI